MKASVDEYIENGKPKKACPIHVRGAIEYNKLIDNNDIKSLAKIDQGSKIKYLYMNENLFSSHVFPWLEPYPIHIDEFKKIAKYVDYEKMWEKNVMANINQILDALGIKIQDLNSRNLF